MAADPFRQIPRDRISNRTIPTRCGSDLSLSTQNLYVMEGDRLLMAVRRQRRQTRNPTPTGNFTHH